ncbi:hypothetical protein [Streptomyces sp. Ac-502]|uniref:hypothetical protein n=1 Tax=Streptomyces sp. Ac-502 TaxID=3342801 RepID=UPI0038629B6B
MLTALFVALALTLTTGLVAGWRLRRALTAERAARRLADAAHVRDTAAFVAAVRNGQRHHHRTHAVLADADAVLDRALAAHHPHTRRREGDGHD